ncbi:MAG: nitrilase [Cyclobacteriaceae bacterium]|jgi:nitrilase
MLKIAVAQISPVWLNRQKTTEKIEVAIDEAAADKAGLVVFGEGLLPGYPFWLSVTDGSNFENQRQKEIHAHYMKEAVVVSRGDLDTICNAAKKNGIAVYLGIIERATDRGGHSIYASLVYIDTAGVIQSIHRKLQPTYEERLTWSPGDGHGLRVHSLGEFSVGGLNCWENWMPLARASLYGMGENLHVAVWPGSERNTIDLTRHIAREGRLYAISVSGLMSLSDIDASVLHGDFLRSQLPDKMANGGSCIAGPDGNWVLEPVVDVEGIFYAEITIDKVFQERQNFDPSGHYSRPDVMQLTVNRERQSVLSVKD